VLRETGGACEEVSEQEIAEAKTEIGIEGVGCEPASAATLAGLKKLTRSGFVSRTESVVLILTGHCLKDPEYTLDQRKPALAMEADAAAVIRMLESGMPGGAA
jgi:threonine synthase